VVILYIPGLNDTVEVDVEFQSIPPIVYVEIVFVRVVGTMPAITTVSAEPGTGTLAAGHPKACSVMVATPDRLVPIDALAPKLDGVACHPSPIVVSA
jgi:hypothetical protein